MVSYGNKYPRHNARPHVVEQSGQCARALKVNNFSSQLKAMVTMDANSDDILTNAFSIYSSLVPHVLFNFN